MKVSRKTRYALRAMLELAAHYKEGTLSAKSVSQKQDIPFQYLEQIFNRLKRAGLIKTIRGPQGGYTLSRPPSKINVRDVVVPLEDNNVLVECLTEGKRENCSRSGSCDAQVFWKTLDSVIKKVFNSFTLAELCKNTRKDKKGNKITHSYTFQI